MNATLQIEGMPGQYGDSHDEYIYVYIHVYMDTVSTTTTSAL